MKILVVYASAGAGHSSAAEAIYGYFKKNYPEHDVEIIDILNFTSPLYKKIYSKGYDFLVRYALWLWRVLFFITETKELNIYTGSLASFLNVFFSKRFAEVLFKKKYDIIASTHFFPSEVCSRLKRKGLISPKIINLITDFGVHSFWVASGIDLYIGATDETKKCLLNKGVGESKIKILGIPVEDKFLLKLNKKDIRDKLNIAENDFTVLIVTGSFGIGPIQKLVSLLYPELKIIVVCAHNKRLFEKLKKESYPNTLVFGFVENMHELMTAADVIITKPGGLSISEALVKELAMIFISPIPGQEKENLRIMLKHGVAFYPRNLNKIKNLINYLKNNPQEIEKKKVLIRDLKKPNAIKDICNAICQSCVRASP